MPITNQYATKLINQALVSERGPIRKSGAIRDAKLRKLMKQEKRLLSDIEKEREALELLSEEGRRATEAYNNWGTKAQSVNDEYKQIDGKKQPKRKAAKKQKLIKIKKEKEKIKKKKEKIKEKKDIHRMVKDYLNERLQDVKESIQKRNAQLRDIAKKEKVKITKMLKKLTAKRVARALKKSRGK